MYKEIADAPNIACALEVGCTNMPTHIGDHMPLVIQHTKNPYLLVTNRPS